MAAELWVNDAGTARRVQEIWANDNGTARRIQEIWVNDNGTARCIYVGDQIILDDRIVHATSSGTNATASFALRSDGLAHPNPGSMTPWITPQTNMANYECRATLVSGALSTGTLNAWQSLSVNRTWTRSQSGNGTSVATFTLEIRRASDATVMATAQITIRATVQ